MTNINYQTKADKTLLYFTVPIVILIAICSSVGIWYQNLYSRETIDWLSQCIGQDISNLFFVVPILLVSSFYASKGNKIAKIIWIGTMITNIYSYVIYCFAVHFNFLFHVYCLILGLSIYSVIYFCINNFKEDFRNWFTEKVPTKAIGIFLFTIAVIFVLLWLSQSLPGALTNTVPESISNDGLLTNPIHVLDFSFYLPLIFITAVMIIKKKTLGYILAPMMTVFGIITNINIICLTSAAMVKTSSNNMPLIIGFSIFTIVCLGFLWLMLKNISKQSNT
ncbi:hypothetical protein [Clostridium pasteurianum]|uniref:Uncharacterized protein n=1 Tax=Clostridium pasteurianum BC1 TaxID=86416 RepID=R4K315_CLOPA|nr:hypothetical protein [Clostridium pasteurianum]AGK96988.1 hypothetical protein Clopa_2107 [Clostridium pasteurianum BC1]